MWEKRKKSQFVLLWITDYKILLPLVLDKRSNTKSIAFSFGFHANFMLPKFEHHFKRFNVDEFLSLTAISEQFCLSHCVTSGSRRYKILIKNSKCAISNEHFQDGRPGRYPNRWRPPKKRTNRPPCSCRHPKAPGRGWKESETQCGAITSRKMSEETIQNQGVTCQWIFARTPEPTLEDARGTLSS